MKEESTEPGEDLVTPERLAKGDIWVKKNLKDKISAAGWIDNSIVKKLVKIEVLQYFHEIYGLGFLELRLAFRAESLEKSFFVLLPAWACGVSGGRAIEIYQNVCRGMLGRGLKVVEFAMEQNADRIRQFDNGLYVEHFDRLVELMDKERERIAAENRNAYS